ncbi:MAG TPA: hypothetical protein VGM90_05920 [Kofleriaceae bacterium]
MLRTSLFIGLLTASLALADKAAKPSVRDLPGQAADKVTKAEDLREGCGLSEIASSLGTATTESATGYDEKALLKASTKVASHKGEEVSLKSVYSWCTKPDQAVRVWVACAGQGELSSCKLFAAVIDAKGKLGKATSAGVGDIVTGAKVEDVDSGKATSISAGKVLKVSFTTGRGDAAFGVFIDKNAVKFTKTEWSE